VFFLLARRAASGGVGGANPKHKQMEDEYRELNKQKTMTITKMKSNEEMRKRDMLRA